MAEALRAARLEVMVAPITGDVEHALRAYSPLEWVIYNLGEGFEGRLFEEARIAWALEAMGYRFTGSDAAAWRSPRTRRGPRRPCGAPGCPRRTGRSSVIPTR